MIDDNSRIIFDIGLLFFSSRRRHTRCALVTGVQTCALPISLKPILKPEDSRARVLAEAARLAQSRTEGATNVPTSVPDVLRALVAAGEAPRGDAKEAAPRSEEHTSELQLLMRISYAVFCLKKKKKNTPNPSTIKDIYSISKN